MIKQSIHIINLKSLFSILHEIKSDLPFEIINHDSQTDFLKILKNSQNKFENSLVLIEKINNELQSENFLDYTKILELSELPISLTNLVDNINVSLIKQQYTVQSNVIIQDYILNLNSRIITNKDKELKLTQREIDIIIFLNFYKKPQSINILQNQVWKHVSKLETHTVETHIYRLRKKIKETFDDDGFILSLDDGYLIK
jgi:hypothetical protein|tara:strand:+ start:487 stop:1086 length:600 start_codon:yes stop_codon:yes gene_type:complete